MDLPQLGKKISEGSIWGLCRSLSFAFEDDIADGLISSLYEFGWKDQSVTVLFKSTVHTGCLLLMLYKKKKDKDSLLTIFPNWKK